MSYIGTRGQRCTAKEVVARWRLIRELWVQIPGTHLFAFVEIKITRSTYKKNLMKKIRANITVLKLG